MISAGRTYGILSRGMRARYARDQRLNDDQIDELAKKKQEHDEKWLKKKLAKVKKIGLGFPKCVLPIERMVRYRGRMVSSKWAPGGDLCRKGKDKIGKIVPETDNRALKASTDQFTKITKEQFLDLLQARWLVHSKSFRFSNKDDIALWKKGKKAAKNSKAAKAGKAAKAKVIKEYKKFRKLYLKDLREQFIKKLFVMVDGEIYMKPPKDKTIKAAKGIPYNPNNQCYDTRLDRLDIYEDCDCAFEDGDVKCEYLHEDKFPKRLGNAPEGEIRLKIYYNRTTQKIRLIPDRDNFAAPTGYLPVNMRALKRLLSRHKDKGGKLLLEFLKLKETRKLATETSPIFRNEDGHYVTDIDSIDYLSKYSVYIDSVHKGRTYPAGIYLNEKEAKEFITKVNKDPEILKLTRGMPPFNPTNFARTPTKQSGLWEYMIPKDPALLLKVFELVDRMKKGKVKTSLPSKTIDAMHGRLKHLVKADLSANFRHEMAKWQKRFNIETKKDQSWWQGLGMSVQALFILLIAVTSTISVWAAIKGVKHMRIIMLQATDPEKARKLLRADQDKLDEKARKKAIAKLERKKNKGKLTQAEARQLKSLKQEREKHIMERSLEDWERDIQGLTVKEGKEMKGELVEYETFLLRENPDWLIPGRDHEGWETLRARTNTGEETSPFVYGTSGSGKRYVHMTAAQKVAMAYIYENERGEIKERLHAKYQERYDAHSEFFGNDPASVQREVDYYMGKYKEAAETLDPRLREHRFYLIHNAKLQAGTGIRGSQADKVLQCFRTNEHSSTPIMQEFATILMAGATSGGAGQDVDVSESVLELTKQHIEGSSEVGTTGERAENSLSNGINADTTPHRALKVRTDPRSEDLSRRFLWIPNHVWSPQETLEHIHAPRIYEVVEKKFNVRLSPEAREAAVRIGVHFEGKPGRIPLTAANSVLKGAADHIVKAEKRGGWDGKKPIVITAQHMFDYARVRYNVPIENPAEVGKLKMQQPREYFMFKRDVRAMKEIQSSTVTIMAANRASSEYVMRHIRGNEPGIVRSIATTIDLDAIGDFEDAERNPQKANEAARVAVLYARRLHKLGNSDIPTNTNDLQMWIEQNLDKVLPISDEVVERADTVLQEEILRAMDPTNAKYAADTVEERNECMLKDAKTLEAELLLYAGDPKGEKPLHELIQSIPTVVVAHETDQTLQPKPEGDGPKGGSRGSGEAPHRPAAQPRSRPKAPPPPRGGGNPSAGGGSAGTGKSVVKDRRSGAEAPKPAAPKETAPKPASESDPKARARKAQTRLLSKVRDMLPDALKPYAKHVAIVCQRRSEFLRLGKASQRAVFTVLATKAMQRQPEVIGGSRKGVRVARLSRRARARTRHTEERRMSEHLMRLNALRRLRKMRRGGK